MQTIAPDSFCPLTNPQPYQRERDKPRQGVVANTLRLFRSGAVGFIEWLEMDVISPSICCSKNGECGLSYTREFWIISCSCNTLAFPGRSHVPHGLGERSLPAIAERVLTKQRINFSVCESGSICMHVKLVGTSAVCVGNEDLVPFVAITAVLLARLEPPYVNRWPEAALNLRHSLPQSSVCQAR